MYATVDNLRQRLGTSVCDELYLDTATADELIAEDIDAAAAEIDGAIASRYVVPVTAPDSIVRLLKGWNLTLAEELAWTRGGADKIPDKVAVRVDSVRKRLAEVRDSKFALSGAAETTSGGGNVALIDIAEPVFTRDKMRGF